MDDRRSTLAPPSDPGGEAEFFAAVKNRLQLGAAAYGDRSFSRDPTELFAELEQEALDLAGWGYVVWRRIRRARAALAEVEASFK